MRTLGKDFADWPLPQRRFYLLLVYQKAGAGHCQDIVCGVGIGLIKPDPRGLFPGGYGGDVFTAVLPGVARVGWAEGLVRLAVG